MSDNHRFVFTLFVLLFLAFFSVSCDDGSLSPENLVPVSLSLGYRSKNLSVSKFDEPTENLTFWYTMTACFSGDKHGEVLSDTKLSLNSKFSTTLGPVSPGRWIISVKAKNDKQETVYSGNADVILRPGHENSFTINLTRNYGSGTGSVSASFTCPMLGSSGNSIVLMYRKPGEVEFDTLSQGWTATLDNGKWRYDWEFDLSAGVYEMHFLYYQDDVRIGGETVVCEVFSDKTTLISGKIESGSAVNQSIRINLSESGSQIVDSSITVNKNEQKIFTWKNDSGEIVSYNWTINGVSVDCHTAQYTFCESESGIYYLTCIASSVISSSAMGGISSKTATYKIIVCDSISVEFIRLRAQNSGNQICIGYKEAATQQTVSFPYDTISHNSDGNYGDYGLEPIYFDNPTASKLKNQAPYLETGTTLSYTPSSGYSILGAKSTSPDWTVKEAVINLTKVPDHVLFKSVVLERAVLTESVQEVGNYVFQDCQNLKEVYLGKNITKIGANAFQNCSALRTVYLEGASWPEGWNLNKSTLDDAGVQIVFNYSEKYFK